MKSNMLTMVASLTLIAGGMGALLGVVHDATAEPIAKAQELAKAQALEAVLPPMDNGMTKDPIEITVEGDTRPVQLYPAFDNGNPCGAAVETWTMDGFSGEITVMVGFNANGEISGFKVLQSAETPGLGAKADEWFRSEVVNDEPSTGATAKNKRSIIGTKGELKVSKDGGQIDGITAATITSRAFLDAVNRARRAYNQYSMIND